MKAGSYDQRYQADSLFYKWDETVRFCKDRKTRPSYFPPTGLWRFPWTSPFGQVLPIKSDGNGEPNDFRFAHDILYRYFLFCRLHDHLDPAPKPQQFKKSMGCCLLFFVLTVFQAGNVCALADGWWTRWMPTTTFLSSPMVPQRRRYSHPRSTSWFRMGIESDFRWFLLGICPWHIHDFFVFFQIFFIH